MTNAELACELRQVADKIEAQPPDQAQAGLLNNALLKRLLELLLKVAPTIIDRL